MKETTGELNMTIVAIIVIVALGVIGFWLFGDNGLLRPYIYDLFSGTIESGMGGN